MNSRSHYAFKAMLEMEMENSIRRSRGQKEIEIIEIENRQDPRAVTVEVYIADEGRIA